MKKMISALLIAVMLLGILPAGILTAYAAEPFNPDSATWSDYCAQNGGHFWYPVEGGEDVPATCTADGYYDAVCTCCGARSRQIRKSLGHSYHGGVCADCGKTLPELTELHVPDVTLYDGLDNSVWDPQSRSYVSGSFQYERFVQLELRFADGSVMTDRYAYLRNTLADELLLTDDQPKDAPWGLGVHTATVNVGDLSCSFRVTVEQNPIERVEVDDIERVEGSARDEEYSCYPSEFEDSVRIYLRDGSVIDSDEYYPWGDNHPWELSNFGVFLDNIDIYDRCTNWSVKLLDEEPWTVGSEHQVELTVAQVSCRYRVRIIEDPVDYIEVSDMLLHEGENFHWENAMQAAYMEGLEHLANRPLAVYDLYPSLELTIHYKNGEVRTFSDFSPNKSTWNLAPEVVRRTGYYVDISKPLELRGGQTYRCTATLCLGLYDMETEHSCEFDLTMLPQSGFMDVTGDRYYAGAVRWAAEQQITTGTAELQFSPNEPCTRAQIVTFLWRACGSPAPKDTTLSFTDVKPDSYYADAVRWAVEQGITTGTKPGLFSPNAPCTRAQAATFLWRAAGKPAANGANPFADVQSDDYCFDAIRWAVEAGIARGTSETAFNPGRPCTRAQIVTFLYRMYAD